MTLEASWVCKFNERIMFKQFAFKNSINIYQNHHHHQQQKKKKSQPQQQLAPHSVFFKWSLLASWCGTFNSTRLQCSFNYLGLFRLALHRTLLLISGSLHLKSLINHLDIKWYNFFVISQKNHYIPPSWKKCQKIKGLPCL